MYDRDFENAVWAIGTLAAGLGAAGALVLTAHGRTREVYAIASAGAVATAFVASAYALGGERPMRLKP